jgi:hypothetical protein
VSSRPVLRPTQPPIQWLMGTLSPGVRWPWCECDHSPPTSAEVKKTWIYTSTIAYAFVAQGQFYLTLQGYWIVKKVVNCGKRNAEGLLSRKINHGVLMVIQNVIKQYVRQSCKLCRQHNITFYSNWTQNKYYCITLFIMRRCTPHVSTSSSSSWSKLQEKRICPQLEDTFMLCWRPNLHDNRTQNKMQNIKDMLDVLTKEGWRDRRLEKTA